MAKATVEACACVGTATVQPRLCPLFSWLGCVGNVERDLDRGLLCRRPTLRCLWILVPTAYGLSRLLLVLVTKTAARSGRANQ